MPRLIAVSNRVASLHQDTPTGGLAVGVLAALKSSEGGLWFGWSGETTDASTPKITESQEGEVKFVTVDLPKADFEDYYNGFCNATLWPLHHYFPGNFRYRPSEFEAYLRINRWFARSLLPLLRDGDVIWIHDYQLIPLGSFLREAGVTARIGFFLHIPFPNIAVLRLLPPYADLVRSMCEYDLVGFQTDEDLQGFISAVRNVFANDFTEEKGTLRVNDKKVGVGAYPIGVDVEKVAAQAEHAMREDPEVNRLVQGLLGRKLLLGVDRLDYSKGLVERFNAYRGLLELKPELQGQVTLIQISPLSRTNVAAYAEIRDSLERTAGHINGKFADTDWTPIRYLNKDFSHQTLSGFLRSADVGVVTPLRDGMNLVAKEYVASQDPEAPGVLVLSTLAGAALELTAAVLVNPYDRDAVAFALDQALHMPLAERKSRHRDMMQALRDNSIDAWHRSFVARLNESASRIRSAHAE